MRLSNQDTHQYAFNTGQIRYKARRYQTMHFNLRLKKINPCDIILSAIRKIATTLKYDDNCMANHKRQGTNAMQVKCTTQCNTRQYAIQQVKLYTIDTR